MKKQIVRLDERLFLMQKDNIYKCFLDLLKQNDDKSKELLNNMEKFIDNGSAIIYVSMIENNIIGFIWGYFIKEKKIHINYFVVLDKYRGKKIGYELLNVMINMNKNNSFELLVNIENERAIKFYERYGFKRTKIINGKLKMKIGGEFS